MSFAEQWAKDFFNEYDRQKIDDWWYKLRKDSDPAWTNRMAEFLRSLAQRKGYQMEYEITTDFSFYKEKSTSPSIAIEHENTYSQDIFKEELLKLLENNAPLKILITYIKKEEEEKELIKRFKKIHKMRVLEPITKQINEEFLFMITDYYGDLSKARTHWRWYIFYPTGKFVASQQKPHKP
jgi:hypothetical protein